MSQATNISVYVSLPFVFAFFLRFSREKEQTSVTDLREGRSFSENTQKSLLKGAKFTPVYNFSSQ